MLPLVPKESAAKFLASVIPDTEWLLSKIESEQGWFRFPPVLTRIITNLKIEFYPLFYENENAIGLLLQRALFSESAITEINQGFETASPQERGEMIEWLTAGIDAFMEGVNFPKTPHEEEEAQAQFDALSSEEQAEAVRVLSLIHI